MAVDPNAILNRQSGGPGQFVIWHNANRGDDRLGWDTDQFPNSVDSLVPAVYEIIRGGGFDTGGFMFDTKLRRMSIDRSDLFHGHVGGIDTLAKAFLVAHEMVTDNALENVRSARYAPLMNNYGPWNPRNRPAD